MKLLLVAALAAVAFSGLVVRKPMHKFSSLKGRRQNREYKTGRGPQRVLTSDSIAFIYPITDFYDDFYLINISLGTPAQEFTVMLDTGSSDLWVADAKCHTPACKGSPDVNYTKHQFDTTQSSTFKRTREQFTLYGVEGANTGYIGTDVFQLAYLRYETQGILVATSVGQGYGSAPMDGVLGLAWPALAYRGVAPVLQNILPQLNEPIFTIWLDRHVKEAENQVGGEITFGDVDEVNCEAQINYVPLTSKTYWQFQIDSFSVDTYSYARSQQAISTTGNSFLSIPTVAFKAVSSATQAQYDAPSQMYYVACNGTYPDLFLTIGGVQYGIPSTEYVLDLDLGGGWCALAVSPYNGGGGFAPAWLLGDVWIRTYCNVYDVGNGRIGFAKARHSEI